jgi:hypothetical protein
MALTIDSIISGSGTNTVTFQLSGNAANGETGSFVYGASNTIEDTSGNDLVAGSTSVTNNVSAGGYSAEAQAVIDRYTGLNTTQQDALATFVDGMVSAGKWRTKQDFLLMAGLGSQANGLISMKGIAGNASLLGGATPCTWSNTNGFTTTVNDCIVWDSPSNISDQQNIEIGVRTKAHTATNNKCLFGSWETPGADKRVYMKERDTECYLSIMSLGGPYQQVGSLINGNGYYTGRSTGTNNYFVKNGVAGAAQAAGTQSVVPTIPLHIGARNYDSSASEFSDGTQFVFAHYGDDDIDDATYQGLVTDLLTDLGVI